MVFLGFAVDYMIRININITIVDMIIPDEPSIRNDTPAVEKHRISAERSLMKILKVNIVPSRVLIEYQASFISNDIYRLNTLRKVLIGTKNKRDC